MKTGISQMASQRQGGVNYLCFSAFWNTDKVWGESGLLGHQIWITFRASNSKNIIQFTWVTLLVLVFLWKVHANIKLCFYLHLERFINVFLSVCWLVRDQQSVSLSVFWFAPFWLEATLNTTPDSWGNGSSCRWHWDCKHHWPLHDLDLQAPSLLTSLTELLATLFDCNLLVCFLKTQNKNSIFNSQ